jgi:glycosyltransferase involved in cell wall biosynthesis
VPTYSLVVPAYNEEGALPELVARLVEVMDALDGDSEAILVDDGSRDRTYELMLEAAARDPRIPRGQALTELRPPDRSPPASTSRRGRR